MNHLNFMLVATLPVTKSKREVSQIDLNSIETLIEDLTRTRKFSVADLRDDWMDFTEALNSGMHDKISL